MVVGEEARERLRVVVKQKVQGVLSDFDTPVHCNNQNHRDITFTVTLLRRHFE